MFVLCTICLKGLESLEFLSDFPLPGFSLYSLISLFKYLMMELVILMVSQWSFSRVGFWMDRDVDEIRYAPLIWKEYGGIFIFI